MRPIVLALAVLLALPLVGAASTCYAGACGGTYTVDNGAACGSTTSTGDSHTRGAAASVFDQDRVYAENGCSDAGTDFYSYHFTWVRAGTFVYLPTGGSVSANVDWTGGTQNGAPVCKITVNGQGLTGCVHDPIWNRPIAVSPPFVVPALP